MRSPFLILAATAATLAAAPAVASAENIVGLDTANRLVEFKTARPDRVKTRPVTGLPAGESLVGIDRRPATGVLFVLGRTSRLYAIDLRSAAAAAVGPGTFTTPLNGTNFGFDFNPMVDRIRIASNFTQNLRVVPDTGAVAASDGALAYAAGDPNAGKAPAVSGAAYTNSVPMAPSTQLFDIDVNQDVLALQDPPNAGGLKTVGPLREGNLQSPIGFDISAKSGIAYASLRVKGVKGSSFVRIDLQSGRATPLGPIGTRKAAPTLRGLTVAE